MVLCLLVNIRVCALIDNSGSMGRKKKTDPLCISASSETLSMLIKRNEGGGKNEITEHNVINKISRRDGRTWNKTNPLEILGIEKKKQWHHVTTNTSKVNHLHNSRQLHQTEVSLTFILIRGVFLRGMRGKEGCQRPWTTKWKYFELVNERYATRNKISTSFFFDVLSGSSLTARLFVSWFRAEVIWIDRWIWSFDICIFGHRNEEGTLETTFQLWTINSNAVFLMKRFHGSWKRA